MDKIHLLVSFLKYILTAKGPDRVHSPFVFNLYYYHLKNRNLFYDFKRIEDFFKQKEQDKSTIQANDLGAGTKHHSNRRVVGKLTKTSSIPAKWGEVLFKIANQVKPQNTLELGTAFGKSTAYIKSGFKQMKLTSIEGDSSVYNVAIKNLKDLKITGATIENTDISTFIKELDEQEKYDYLFLDANHTYNATTTYFNMLLPHINNKAVVIVDDIYWSKEMTLAWKEICKHSRCTVCIDLFRMGIIFMDRTQEKEYFKLRL